MTIQQAINLNPLTASKKQLDQAIRVMKGQYSRATKQLTTKGIESYLGTTMKNIIDTRSEFSLKEKDRTYNQSRSVFSEFRDYSGHRIVDDEGKVTGWERNETATAQGAIDYLKRVGSNVLGLDEDEYLEMSDLERGDLWDFISDIRESRPEYFRQGSGAYGSDDNIKKVTEYYHKGYTKEEAIKALIGSSTIAKAAEENERNARIAASPFDLVSRKDF